MGADDSIERFCAHRSTGGGCLDEWEDGAATASATVMAFAWRLARKAYFDSRYYQALKLSGIECRGKRNWLPYFFLVFHSIKISFGLVTSLFGILVPGLRL